jgi:sterol desaturase/sphingolipid hydroxylase (fatty acid hydroxylase superfamily)
MLRGARRCQGQATLLFDAVSPGAYNATPMPLRPPSEVTKFVLCLVILLVGLALAWMYLRGARRAHRRRASRFEELLGDRPWRRLGAGIAGLLAVMFVAGVYVVDIPDRPLPYAVYWIIMLGMVVWLCALAVKDAMHTRRTYSLWRKERTREAPEEG